MIVHNKAILFLAVLVIAIMTVHQKFVPKINVPLTVPHLMEEAFLICAIATLTVIVDPIYV